MDMMDIMGLLFSRDQWKNGLNEELKDLNIIETEGDKRISMAKLNKYMREHRDRFKDMPIPLMVDLLRYTEQSSKDPQMGEEYDWEEAHRRKCEREEGILNLKQVKKLNQDLLAKYNFKGIPFKVVLDEGISGAHTDHKRCELHINPKMATRWVVCHETSHMLLLQTLEQTLACESHGPEFVRTLIEVYSNGDQELVTTLITDARAAGLRVADNFQIPYQIPADYEFTAEQKEKISAVKEWQAENLHK